MLYTNSLLLTTASLLATVSAHGFLLSPPPRLAGDAFKASCGTQVYYNQVADTYGNIQGEIQIARGQADFNAATCNLWQCKGFKFDDNKSKVQTYTAGQVVPFEFDLRAPHAGVANVSIVDTATNSIIGQPLVTYSDFGNNAYAIPANQLKFSVTIPSNLGSKCAVAGACVIQHYWDAPSIDQTYEACVDFTVGGTGSGSPAPAPAPATTAAPAPQPTATATPTTLQTLTRNSSVAAPTSTTPTQEDDCEEL